MFLLLYRLRLDEASFDRDIRGRLAVDDDDDDVDDDDENEEAEEAADDEAAIHVEVDDDDDLQEDDCCCCGLTIGGDDVGDCGLDITRR